MFTELEPIPHFKLTDFVRVPVWRNGKEYIVYTGRRYRRRYTLATLPDCIKSKITLANCMATTIKDDLNLSIQDVFVCDDYTGEEDTAWRASENMYVVIIHVNDFYEIQGEEIDTRKEDKN